MRNGFNNEYTYMELLYQMMKRWRRWLLYSVCCFVLLIIVKIPALGRVIINSGMITFAERIVRYLIYGCLFGTLLLMFWYLLKYSDRIVSERFIRDSSEIELLGILPGKNLKNTALDRFVKRLFGIKRKRKDLSGEKAAIIADLERHVLLEEPDREYRIAVVSSYDGKIVEEFLQQMEDFEHPSFSFIGIGDVPEEGEELEKLFDADMVVLVECQEFSKYSDLRFLLRKLYSWKKEVVGLVLTGVDAL